MNKKSFPPALNWRHLIIAFFLSVIVSTVRGQEVLFEGDIACKGGTEIFPLVDEAGQQTFLLMKDNRSLRCYRFNKDFKILGTLEEEIPTEISFATLLGHSVQSDGIINLFFNSSSPDDHDIAIITFDYGNQKVNRQLLELPLKGEFVAGAIGHNEHFFIFSAKRSSSTLKLYAFTGHDTNYDTRTYDFNNEKFANYSKELSNILRKDRLRLIDNNLPRSLDLESSKNKLYHVDDKIIMTLDNQPTRTEMITIDVASLNADIRFYPQGKNECNELYSTSNSFIYEGFLYQVIFCDEKMVFQILNLETSELVKEFSVTKDEDIHFKASELLLSGMASIYYDGERDLSKTKQFLRKVAPTNALVSPIRTRQGIRVKLGGAIEIGQPAGAGTPGVVGSYMRSITFNTILGEPTFEFLKHVEIPENMFENISTYKTELDEDAKTLTGGIVGAYVFIFDNTLVLGHFHRKKKKYILVGFPSP